MTGNDELQSKFPRRIAATVVLDNVSIKNGVSLPEAVLFKRLAALLADEIMKGWVTKTTGDDYTEWRAEILCATPQQFMAAVREQALNYGYRPIIIES